MKPGGTARSAGRAEVFSVPDDQAGAKLRKVRGSQQVAGSLHIMSECNVCLT